jgi:hypothetical protein
MLLKAKWYVCGQDINLINCYKIVVYQNKIQRLLLTWF